MQACKCERVQACAGMCGHVHACRRVLACTLSVQAHACVRAQVGALVQAASCVESVMWARPGRVVDSRFHALCALAVRAPAAPRVNPKPYTGGVNPKLYTGGSPPAHPGAGTALLVKPTNNLKPVCPSCLPSYPSP